MASTGSDPLQVDFSERDRQLLRSYLPAFRRVTDGELVSATDAQDTGIPIEAGHPFGVNVNVTLRISGKIRWTARSIL